MPVSVVQAPLRPCMTGARALRAPPMRRGQAVPEANAGIQKKRSRAVEDEG